MLNEVRIPDIEIIVGCAGDDIACFAFYLLPDVHQGYDIVCAVSDPDARAVIRQILQDAITALNNADWLTLDGLHQGTVSGEESPPF
jgi:hypothetical protein